jgi:hypothetical protein
MVTLSDDQAFTIAPFRLVRTDDGRVLMTRQLRLVDADAFNRQWDERGIPTRWERLQVAAVA